jgi:hypothetical protein
VIQEIRAEPTAVPDEERRTAERLPQRRHHQHDRHRGRHDRRGSRRA